MYSEISIRTDFKSFYIVPTPDNKMIYKPKKNSVEIDGLLDQVTPFYAYFYFADRNEYNDFIEGYKSRMLNKAKYMADKVRESMVFRSKKIDTPYQKWEFHNTKKLY